MTDLLAKSISQKRYVRLWLEYAQATKGLSLIRPSRDWEKQFGPLGALPEGSLEQPIDYTFRPGTWELVVRGGKDARGEVLELWKGGGGQAVDTFLLAKLQASQS